MEIVKTVRLLFFCCKISAKRKKLMKINKMTKINVGTELGDQDNPQEIDIIKINTYLHLP